MGKTSFILHVRYLESFVNTASGYTDKKKKKNFLIYREIKMGSGAKSYMRKGFLIYEEMHKYFHHIRRPWPYMTLRLLNSEFPYI